MIIPHFPFLFEVRLMENLESYIFTKRRFYKSDRYNYFPFFCIIIKKDDENVYIDYLNFTKINIQITNELWPGLLVKICDKTTVLSLYHHFSSVKCLEI